ncbi:MAG: hypothetical protein IPL16_18265 [Ignavibacteria bacterium]|nr:hypothetical protein [Ignavibacteria bacterium]
MGLLAKFYGYENDGFTERKPGYIVKNSGLERCTEIIEVYLKEDSDFRNFADQFKLAIVNSDFDFLENSIALPLEDGYRENLSKIKSGKEFCKRIKLYFGDFQTSTAEYFAHYWRELEAANNYPGAYFFSGSINMIFEKVNGAYKLTRMGSWG